MASKAISTIGKYAAKKIGNKTFDKAIQKISEPYERLKRKTFGIKPLNVGERNVYKIHIIVRVIVNPLEIQLERPTIKPENTNNASVKAIFYIAFTIFSNYH